MLGWSGVLDLVGLGCALLGLSWSFWKRDAYEIYRLKTGYRLNGRKTLQLFPVPLPQPPVPYPVPLPGKTVPFSFNSEYGTNMGKWAGGNGISSVRFHR
jgi:hypothetical protein